HLFARFVSIGSPLGGLGVVPRIPLADINVVSANRRRVHVDWIDVATNNDPIATKRVAGAAGFEGRGHSITSVTLQQKDPNRLSSITAAFDAHAAYFFDESLARQWINHLSV